MITDVEVSWLDRYEYKLKLEQIKDLFNRKDCQTAATIADTINWKKVKNTSNLCMVGEIYAQIKQYEISRDILLMAYERSPLGRPIIYRLTQVAIKLGILDEAEEYYEEFLNIAPHDNMKYVLKYEIAKARGGRQEELIEILEEFKDKEYTEEWTFELAYLYHKAEMEAKCVEICDELILWFGDGEFVEKALELKMIYQPLNKLQEDKYNRIKLKQEEVVKIKRGEQLHSGESLTGEVNIRQVTSDTGKFSTMNLQKELAKSMQQIIEAKEKETVSDTMQHIKNMVKEIPYIETSEKEPDAAPEYEIGEHTDYVRKQITEEVCIGDILAEWEEEKEKEEKKQLENIRSQALHETQELLDQITDALPEIQNDSLPVQDTIPLPELKLPNFLKAEEKKFPDIKESIWPDEDLPDTGGYIEKVKTLTQEQKKIFSYFISVEGMERQILQAFAGITQRKKNQQTSLSGNLVIVGGRGAGKTVFATCMIKAVQKVLHNPSSRVGKITGSSMNQKDIAKLLKKVEGGYLIIERAGDLAKESVLHLSSIMDYDTKGLLVILEDTKIGIEKVLSRNAMFTSKFTEKIRIPVFTSNELVAFAQAYANEHEFDIDEMGILALYNCISNIQKLDQPTTLEEVKDIMDQAMEKSQKRGIMKIFGGKRYNEKGQVYLKERDFDD